MGGVMCILGPSTFIYVWLIWLLVLLFEGFLCTLAVIRSIELRKPFGPSIVYRRGLGLVHVLFKDSIIYFTG